jgi:WD40 repeat protein
MKRIFTTLVTVFIVYLSYSQNGKETNVFKTDSEIIFDICFAENGEALAVADNTNIKLFSTKSKELLGEFKDGHKDKISSIDISKDNSLLVSSGIDGVITVWDYRSKKILNTLTYQKGIITSVKLSPDNRYLVSGGTDHKVYLYDLKENKVAAEFTYHTNDITSVSFSPDGKLFASASSDNLISVYSIETQKLITRLKGHKGWVRDISFSVDGTKLISCGDDSRIIVWNIADINNIEIAKNEVRGLTWILCVRYNEDNETYVNGDLAGNVSIVGVWGVYRTNMGVPVNKVLFKPNEGTYLKLAIATRGKGVIFMDAADMKH